jgi:hypothetical protein
MATFRHFWGKNFFYLKKRMFWRDFPIVWKRQISRENEEKKNFQKLFYFFFLKIFGHNCIMKQCIAFLVANFGLLSDIKKNFELFCKFSLFLFSS